MKVLLLNDVHVYTDDADVLYNKFNVSYNSTHPNVPNNPPLNHNSNYECAVARRDWKVANCSQKHHVVCQAGLTL